MKISQMTKKWRKQNYRGELYEGKDNNIGSIYWECKGHKVIVTSGEYGFINKIIGEYEPTEFVSAGQFDYGYMIEKRFELKK